MMRTREIRIRFHGPDSPVDRFLAFRERIAGTAMDLIGGLAVVLFVFGLVMVFVGVM